MLYLSSGIDNISRVGKATAAKLKRLGLFTAEDLLFYFPFRYDDFSQVTRIKDLRSEMSANIIGQIEMLQSRRSHRRRMHITEAIVNDGTDSMKVIWFNQPYISKSLKTGDTVSLSGKVDDNTGIAAFLSPAYEKISRNEPIHTQGFVPNYHLTSNLTQKQIRFLIKQVVPLSKKISDWMPSEVIKNCKLLDLSTAIEWIHFPKTASEIAQARKRLSFDELFLIQLESGLLKSEYTNSKAEKIEFFENETKNFVQSLPFKLTNSQRKTAWEIIKDIGKDEPMSRLLEGDVGSGKTLVAGLSMLNVALNKKQSVLMVPTEILAQQHFNTLKRLFGNLKIGLITRTQKSVSVTEDKPTIDYIIRNTDVIIGTHALIQEKINFKRLALAIIDEQHRFGVEQRKLLIEKSGIKNKVPHLLTMTATPIPRTLALALYGDLDISIINELPKDRKKIQTHIVPEIKRGKAYEFIRKQIEEGRQVFVICPLIDFSDKLGVKSVKDEYEKLDKVVFPDIPTGMLHGRMKAVEKENIMRDFLENKIKILVSTSVVEVGVDVPNATIMMIEGAERFGLAQIHQFRGRVGRSSHQSYCFLFTDSNSEKSLDRLKSLEKVNDGFELAKIDLKFRGPGEVYGTAQKGFPELKIASLFDNQLIKLAKEESEKIIHQDRFLNKWPKLKEKMQNWRDQFHFE